MRANTSRQGSALARAGLALVIGIVALLTAAPTASAAPAAPSAAPTATSSTGLATASEIDTFIRKERAELKLSGLSVVVLSHGSVTFDRSYGDAAPGGPAVTSKTPFVLGSTSKQFTALAIQQLIAQGKLSLDHAVGTLLAPLGGEASRFSGVRP